MVPRLRKGRYAARLSHGYPSTRQDGCLRGAGEGRRKGRGPGRLAPLLSHVYNNALRALGITRTVPSPEPLHTEQSARYMELILVYLTRKFCISQRAADGVVGGSVGPWKHRRCGVLLKQSYKKTRPSARCGYAIHQHAVVVATCGGRAEPRLLVARRTLVKRKRNTRMGIVKHSRLSAVLPRHCLARLAFVCMGVWFRGLQVL